MDDGGFILLRPWWLLALPVSWLIWIMVPSQHDVGSLWDRLISPHLKRVMLIQTESQPSRYPWLAKALLCVGWTLAMLALSGPSCTQLPSNLAEKSSAQVMVIDLSASMLAQDIKPSRIQRVHYKIRDLVERFPERHTGIVLYAGSAHAALPISSDPDNLKNMLDTLYPQVMPLAGNRLDLGIKLAAELFENAGWTHGDILVFTDDIEDTVLEELREHTDSQRYSLSVFGVGTEQGAPIPLSDGVYLKDENYQIILSQVQWSSLKRATASLNGQFSPMTVDDSDIRALGLDTERRHAQMESIKKTSEQWQDQGYWLVLPLVLLSLMAFRKGWAGCVMLPVALSLLLTGGADVQAQETPSPADDTASTTRDTDSSGSAERLNLPDIRKPRWWLNDDQNAYRLLKQAPAKAAELFQDPNWKAAAHYRAGNYPEAAKAFGALGTAEGDYNQGNAYLAMQDYASAMSSYQRALKKKPALDDAKHNLALAEELLKEQRKRQQQQQANNQQNQAGQQASQSSAGNGQQQQDNRSQPNDGDGDANEPSQQAGGDQPTPEQQPNQGQANAQRTPGDPPYPQQSDQQHDQNQPAAYNPNTQALNAVPDDPGGLFRNKFRREVENDPPEPLRGKSW